MMQLTAADIAKTMRAVFAARKHSVTEDDLVWLAQSIEQHRNERRAHSSRLGLLQAKTRELKSRASRYASTALASTAWTGLWAEADTAEYLWSLQKHAVYAAVASLLTWSANISSPADALRLTRTEPSDVWGALLEYRDLRERFEGYEGSDASVAEMSLRTAEVRERVQRLAYHGLLRGAEPRRGEGAPLKASSAGSTATTLSDEYWEMFLRRDNELLRALLSFPPTRAPARRHESLTRGEDPVEQLRLEVLKSWLPAVYSWKDRAGLVLLMADLPDCFQPDTVEQLTGADIKERMRVVFEQRGHPVTEGDLVWLAESVDKRRQDGADSDTIGCLSAATESPESELRRSSSPFTSSTAPLPLSRPGAQRSLDVEKVAPKKRAEVRPTLS